MGGRLRRTRVRLTLAYLVGFAVLVAAASVAFWVVFADFQYAALDSSLATQAQALTAGLEFEGTRVSFHGGDTPLPGDTTEGIAITALLVSRTGRTLDTSGSVAPATASAFAAAARRTQGHTALLSATIGGRAERVLVRRVGGEGAHALLVLGRPLGEVLQTLDQAAIMLALTAVGLTVGAALLGYFVAGRALRPVGTMAATVRDITEHDLGRRIALDLPAGDELGDLARTFNDMLARLQAAFDGLQRFTADAAHELRAPLTLLRTQVDITLRRPRTAFEYEASHRVIRTELERLTRTAEQLLLLARADAGTLVTRREAVDIGDLVLEVAERWRLVARERQVQVATEVAGVGGVAGDPDLLRRCLDNLVDNALRHSPAGGTVRLGARLADGRWTVAVRDQGPGVPDGLRPHLFERFTRADPARGRGTGGAGLGLSLCAAIASAHGGSIVCAPAGPGAGADFRLTVPAAPRPAPAPAPVGA